MERRSLILSVITAAVALAFPAGVRAQNAAEPVYLVTLPDKQVITLTTLFQQEADGAKAARVVTLPDGYGKSDLSLLASVGFDPSGYPAVASVQFGPKTLPKAIKLQAKRVEGENATKAADWAVNVPANSETIPYSGTPIVLTLAHGMLGRQYDFARGGEQPFLCFLDFGVLTPAFHPITLRYDGTETIVLESGPVKARRLKYKTELPYLPKIRTKAWCLSGHAASFCAVTRTCSPSLSKPWGRPKPQARTVSGS
jgi:hypothetical protein